ncbi:hypothetical protein SRHO_G00057420 [Serrasalmus rhombeus]
MMRTHRWSARDRRKQTAAYALGPREGAESWAFSPVETHQAEKHQRGPLRSLGAKLQRLDLLLTANMCVQLKLTQDNSSKYTAAISCSIQDPIQPEN